MREDVVLNMKRGLIYSFYTAILIGCYIVNYEDVSDKGVHVALVGAKYKTLSELLIIGITLDQNYKKVIGIYSVIEYPGFSGREVLSRDALPIDTAFQIIKVERCTNCLSSQKRLVIKLLSSQKYSKHIVSLNYKKIFSPNLFERIK
jgi:hypothetical protein